MKNQIILHTHKIHSMEFIKAYLITMRPYLLFVSGITGLTGLSLIPATNQVNVILVFLASFLSYGFGQALTDCFQIDTDELSSPYRPLTQGIISKNHVLIISILGLIFCVSIFWIFNPVNVLLGVTAGLGLYSYTYFKKKWWAGPFYNAWIVAVLFLMAFLTGQPNWLDIDIGVFTFTLLTVFWGYTNFVLSGYFKDINADRKTGYNTLPVVHGRRISAVISDIFAALTIFFSFLAILYCNTSFVPGTLVFTALFFVAGFILSITAQYRLHKVKTDEEAHAVISPVVHSYILILSSISIAHKPEWIIPLIYFYLCFIIVMKTRPKKNQV
ncbi:UbiA family prenyltransferase [Bacteroidota bacterium]